jgi:hypothetical protein
VKIVRLSTCFLFVSGALALGLAGACGGGDSASTTVSLSDNTTSSGQGGGTGNGGGGSGGGVSAKKACTDYATAECMRLGACSNGFQINLRYGDEMTCEFRVEQACEAALVAPDSGESGDDVEGCAAAIPNQTCAALFSNVGPNECAPKGGPRANNAGCGSPWQCKSGWCELNKQSTCGDCSSAPLGGSQCGADTDCSDGFICFRNSCQPPAVSSGACNKTVKPCQAGLSCVGATDTVDGTCQKAADSVGALCDPALTTGAGCNGAIGLYCHPTMKTCQKVVLVDAGQPCGVVKNHVVACNAAGLCDVPAMKSMGTCVAAAGDTKACDIQAGPTCAPPAVCVVTTGTAGTCTFPDPGACKQ